MKTGHWRWSFKLREWRPCNCIIIGNHYGATLINRPVSANEDHIIRGEN